MPQLPPNESIPLELGLSDNDLRLAADRFGTPLYLYDEPALTFSWNRLREALPPRTPIHYSLKANPSVALVRVLARLGARFEISSPGELGVVQAAGGSLDETILLGPGKSREELAQAVRLGVGLIVVESAHELEQLEAVVRLTGGSVRAAVRINPDGGSGALRMAGATQFGMDPDDAVQMLKSHAPDSPVRMVGVHGYLGTRVLDANALVDNAGRVLDAAAELQERTGLQLPFVDVGGGFGVALYRGEKELDREQVRAGLTQRFEAYRRAHPWTQTLAVESGRYLVARSGVMLTRVVNVKQVHGRRFAVVDGGLHVIGGRDGYLGARVGPMRRVEREGMGAAGQEALEVVNICGPLCTPADRLAAELTFPPLVPGDLVVLYFAGAYGLSASPGLFLSRGFPAEAVWNPEGMRQVRKPFGPEQMLALQGVEV